MNRDLSRRTLLVGLVGAPALAALLAACGDDSKVANPLDSTSNTGTGSSTVATTGGTTTPTSATVPNGGGTIAHPAGADDVVVRLAYVGGFVPQGYAFTSVPTVLISGDGHLYAPGAQTAIYPGPILPPITVRTITEDGIQKVLQAASEAGLLATPPDYTQPDINIADAPDTQLVLTVDGGSYVHQAYALGLADPAETKARNVLNGVVIQIADIGQYFGAENLGPEEPFVPTSYRIQAIALDEANLPAADVQPAPMFVDWPTTTGVTLASAAECVVISAEAAGTTLSDANQLTYFVEDGVTYSVFAVGVLPGDAC